MYKPILVLVLILFSSVSCAKWQQDFKHLNSQMIGLKRIVTLYSADGKVIKEWRGNNMRVEHVPGGISFIHEGKVIIISGTFTVEED